MERLQAAIEKARAQREGAVAPQPARAPGGLEPARAPAAASLDEVWGALRELAGGGILPAGASDLVSAAPGAHTAPYDMLRTRVIQQAQANGWKRIAVVSPAPGSGKTTTLANLAFSLARQGDYRTTVLDFDLRRVTLARMLAQKVEHTMADVLEGRVPFAEHGLRHGLNLAFGLNSEPVAAPAELLQSQRARQTLAEIEAIYQPDFVLCDVPPLLAADDSHGFLKNVDCALIVVAAEETPMSQIDVAERQVAELTQVMGVVLNKCRMADNAYYSYDYAGY